MSESSSAAALTESEERNYTSLGNLLGIIGGFVPSLIVWLVFKDRSEFVDRNMKSALNFQLTMLLAYIVGSILLLFVIGGLVMLAAGVLSLIFSILAFIKTKDGEDYTYPMTIRFIK